MAYILRALPSHLNMGIPFPCHELSHSCNAPSEKLEALMRSLSFTASKSISINVSPRKFLTEGSLCFNGRGTDPFHLKTRNSTESPIFRPDKFDEPESLGFSPFKKRTFESTVSRVDGPKHQAVMKLQKVHKSFMTRRDCAVIVEQRWWKLLDFAMLKLTSVSFFDIEKPESAISRWSRARTKAAKVGKGLSKNGKAQKLALQHWLEAIDPQHRYGHNLQFYYDCWLQSESMEPFFYWLDVGVGKEVNLEAQCSRSKLQEQCIKYLGPRERETYEVTIEDGKFIYRKSRQLLNTAGDPTDAKWIFVLSTSRNLYVAQKKKGKFQHSSFLAGGATSAAGQLVIQNGVLKAVWPHSGHYRPTEENFNEFMSFLKENNVDLTNVKRNPSGGDDQLYDGLNCSHSEANLAQIDTDTETEKQVDLPCDFNDGASRKDTLFESVKIACPRLKLRGEEKATTLIEMPVSCTFHKQIAFEDYEESVDEVDVDIGSVQRSQSRTSLDWENEESKILSKYYVFRKKLFFTKVQDDECCFVPPESILGGLNLKRGIESYELGKQLSFRWTTNIGPQIGCVQDYPSKFQALMQVILSLDLLLRECKVPNYIYITKKLVSFNPSVFFSYYTIVHMRYVVQLVCFVDPLNWGTLCFNCIKI